MPLYDSHAICKAAIAAFRTVIKEINSKVEKTPEIALEKQYSPRRKKLALGIDLLAEYRFADVLADKLREDGEEVEVFGEESITQDITFDGRPGVFALADVIDGTDLLERGLSNWCSAVVFFCPQYEKGKKIIAAFVGLPSRDIFYTYEGIDSVKVYLNAESHPHLKHEDLHRDVKRASTVDSLDCASICFYGQKPTNHDEVAQTALLPRLVELSSQESNNVEDIGKVCRLYTLAGIPMMVKLIDHRVKTAANIDAVFDIHGQSPHDVVAGAYLAIKAGAVMKNLDGNNISNDVLEDSLLAPSSVKFKYVLASTEKLCDDLLELVARPRPRDPSEHQTTHEA